MGLAERIDVDQRSPVRLLPCVPGRNQLFGIFQNLLTESTLSLRALRGSGCALTFHSTPVKAHYRIVADTECKSVQGILEPGGLLTI